MYVEETARLRRLMAWILVATAGALGAASAARGASLNLSAQLTAEGRAGHPARPNPASICLGEVLEVVATASHPTDPGARVSLAIGGQQGARRFLQFRGEPGKRRIHIAAQSEDGLTETRTEVLEVGPCEVPEIPGISSRQNPYHPFRVDFRLSGTEGLGPDFVGYHWDFGDGQTAFSEEVYVSHDYGASMTGQEPYRTFLVQIARQPFVAGQAPAGSLVRRFEASVGDSYFFNKQRGILLPPVVHPPVLEARGEQLVGFFSIRNLEPDHIVFQHLLRETLPCDPGGRSRRDPLLPSEVIFQGGVDLEDPDFVESLSYQLSLQIKDSLPWLPEDTQVIPPAYDPDNPPSYLRGKARASGKPLQNFSAPGGTAVAVVPPIPPPPPGPDFGYVVLPGGHTHEGFMTLDAASFDKGECNVVFHLVGETSKGERVYASLYYELRENPRLSGNLEDPGLIQVLEHILDRGWAPDPTEITDEDLHRLQQEGKIRRTDAGWEVI